jgi:nidogen-like
MKCFLKKASVGFRTPLTLMFLFIPTATFAAAVVPFTLTGALLAGDDGSTGPVALGIGGANGIDFFGQSFKTVYVNDNGNVTFQLPVSQFTPSSLATGIGIPIVATFFADVDTGGSGSITYGNATYNGRTAFVADWLNVGYFDSNADKLNTFQLILTDRSDTGAGNFDMEFNYDRIEWETGDASGGVKGFGGTSAAVGYSNGLLGASNVFYQLPGSLVHGAFLDGGPDSLVANGLNSTIAGRYDFQVRDGQLIANTPEPLSISFFAVGLVSILAAKKTLLRH